MTCAVCGQPLPEGARFCPNCGAVVATPLATDERKVVTILFADLVDSTGLAQRLDAERAREVLGRFFDTATEELQALRGRPEKFIGDAVMAVFGLPFVHEDDAVRAVRAGLAIQAKTRRLGRTLGLTEPLDVRVGIESGEAATGIGPAGQLLVTGAVVNAAARLQVAASPGEVLVGETTRALTDGAVSFEERRDVVAKGFDDQLAAFPVTGLSTRSVRRTIPFVGRGSELMIMRECLTRVSSSARPNLVTILGESGIGKSRLADEFVAGLDQDVTVLTGRARTSADTATFAPVAAIVGDLAGIEDDHPRDEIGRRLRALADERCTGAESARTAGRLGLLFGLGDRGRDQSAFVGDVRAGFLALIDGLAEQRAVVVVFEDVHTLKAPMVDLIERLGSGSRREPRRVLTVALARQELMDERPTWAAAAANAVVLRLDPLSTTEAVELVRQASGGRVDDAEAAEIAARAGGNPFFIVETTGMLLRDGDDSIPLVSGRKRGSLPPTVQAVVTARLDALPPRLRELTRRASVFVHSFDLEELTLVDEATDDELLQLEEAEILIRDDGGPRWRLRHATLREVAYASLPKRERARLHEAVAERLLAQEHPSFAADHLELAALASLDLDPDERALPDRAVDALIDAAHRARRRMESRSAIDRYRRALALAGPEDRWGGREARALAGLGESHYWLAEYPAAAEALERAVQVGTTADDPWALALAFRFLGDIAINVEADLDRAEELLDRSLLEAERLGDPWVIVRTLLFAGWVPWSRNRYAEAHAIWQRALDLAEEDDRWARVRALVALSINLTDQDDFDEALRLADEAKALAEQTGDQFSVAVSTVQKARVFEEIGRLEESLPCFDRGVATFEDLGARWELADALAERGIVKRDLGRLDEADEDLRHAVRLSDELGERQLAAWTWKALARVAELRGDDAEAEARSQRAREAEERRPR